MLLSCDIVPLLILAIMVAAHVAFLIMDPWLQNIAYHVEMWW